MATKRETLYRALVATARAHGATNFQTLELLAEAAGTVAFEGDPKPAEAANYQIGDVAPGARVVMGRNNVVNG